MVCGVVVPEHALPSDVDLVMVVDTPPVSSVPVVPSSQAQAQTQSLTTVNNNGTNMASTMVVGLFVPPLEQCDVSPGPTQTTSYRYTYAWGTDHLIGNQMSVSQQPSTLATTATTTTTIDPYANVPKPDCTVSFAVDSSPPPPYPALYSALSPYGGALSTADSNALYKSLHHHQHHQHQKPQNNNNKYQQQGTTATATATPCSTTKAVLVTVKKQENNSHQPSRNNNINHNNNNSSNRQPSQNNNNSDDDGSCCGCCCSFYGMWTIMSCLIALALLCGVAAIVCGTHMITSHKPVGTCIGTNQYWMNNGSPNPIAKTKSNNSTAVGIASFAGWYNDIPLSDIIHESLTNNNHTSLSTSSSTTTTTTSTPFSVFMLARDCVWHVEGTPASPLPPTPSEILIPFFESGDGSWLTDANNASPYAPGGINAVINNVIYNTFQPIIKKDVAFRIGEESDGVKSGVLSALTIVFTVMAGVLLFVWFGLSMSNGLSGNCMCDKDRFDKRQKDADYPGWLCN